MATQSYVVLFLCPDLERNKPWSENKRIDDRRCAIEQGLRSYATSFGPTTTPTTTNVIGHYQQRLDGVLVDCLSQNDHADPNNIETEHSQLNNPTPQDK